MPRASLVVAIALAGMLPIAAACRPSRSAAPVPAPAGTPTGTPAAPAPQAALGRNFDARVGGRVEITGASVVLTFERVVEDSRCPTSVTCITEGDAVVRLAIRGANAESATIDLHAQVPSLREHAFQQFTVRLVQLAPWPKDGGGIRAADYVATLVVVRNE